MHDRYEDIKALIAKHQITMIDFKEIDLAGRWHHLTIPVERFTPELARNGIGFDGSSYGFLTVEKSDMVFIPDLSSAFVDPVAPSPTLTMIGDIYEIRDDYVRFESDPRYVAQKAERFLAESGISDQMLFGPEFEFYLLDNVEYRTTTRDIEVHLDSSQSAWNAINSPYDPEHRNPGYKVPAHGGYHIDLPNDCSYGLRNQIVRTLEDHGIPIKYHHSENGGPGQVEIEIEFATLTEVADR
ncbi:MAG: glutamine synthetase beta-grasp domain-containing protein, partial [Propionibacteriaceae bacterium]|nr:glutamine synthetase beta-grasp domain-containing protein [Propionibacteriaceae bacterium]